MYTLYDGLTYQLSEDMILEGYLHVPSGAAATIDLNGHTLGRELAEASSTGYIILNEGTLTISDSGMSGKITGGMSTNGGELYVKSTIDVFVDSWQALQNEITNATAAKTNGLLQTLNANGNNAIQIQSGKDITIDLRGCDLDRGLTGKGSAGHVIQMKGSSRLTDKNSASAVGKITGT